ncbi:uncharacterized protein N7511_003784 [Penicillium nucicola]|uniref:uncharacterized protein n=1 Tax=Penicillium nucicola TaxID=1850975 RepID=UPI0025456572|nr:uncharacterized protein N7511_003784 [Penicillium nucicola]KAJ5766168.1 hypothetical protein N7511_003784 [Penicillium nucicola]
MDQSTGQSSKRKRLSFACNYCRQKKTRCDEEQPCKTCRLAEVECITTDKRRDGAPVTHRRRTGAAGLSPTQETPNTPDSNLSSLTPASHDRPRLWSQCWVRDRWRTGRLPMMPRLSGASMLELTTEWLDLAFYRLKPPRISSVSPVVNVQFATFVPGPPAIPPPEKTRGLIDLYFETLHRLFPFVNRETVESIYNRTLFQSRDGFSMHHASPPHQALMYLIITTGLMVSPASEESQAQISACVGYCNLLLGYLIATRCLESVQAIFLFSIILRSCDRLAWAWDILAMGGSMAQSIGLNQKIKSHPHQDGNSLGQNEELGYQTWCCLYVFEKILAFESGRPSVIWDRELSGTFADLNDSDAPTNTTLQFRNVSVSLANVLHEMQERSARAWRREEWLPQSAEEAIEEKLKTGGELLVLLDAWRNDLPKEYSFDATSTCRNGPEMAFILFYYNTAVILLHRSTLMISKEEMNEMVTRYAPNTPWKSRLLNGPTIVVEAARDMVKLLVTLVDSGAPNYLLTMTSPLAAVYALAVHIFRERKSLLIRSDFELMKVAMQLIRQSYQKHGTVCNIDDILNGLEQFTLKCLENSGGDPAGQQSNFLDEPPMPDHTSTLASMDLAWGPSAFDWAGWDWNDLNNLLEHSS